MNFIEVSNDEGYFSDDYDTVHCKHGRYIGYPGGPDFLCPECEDGLDMYVEIPVWEVWVHGIKFREIYELELLIDWWKKFTPAIQEHVTLVIATRGVWVKSEEVKP